jgi:uncharacterized membrane protein
VEIAPVLNTAEFTYGGHWGLAVNNAADVVGYASASSPSGSVFHGFVWKNGVTEAITPAAPIPLIGQYPYVKVTDINNSGQLLVMSYISNSKVLEAVPFVFQPSGNSWTAVQLPGLAPAAYTWARKMNDNGDVAGFARVDPSIPPPAGPIDHAFLYQHASGQNVDIHGYLAQNFYISRASDVNNQGRVVGEAWLDNDPDPYVGGPWNAFLFDSANGQVSYLPNNYGNYSRVAIAMSDGVTLADTKISGHAWLGSLNLSGDHLAVVWEWNTGEFKMTALPRLGTCASEVTAMNNHAQIIGLDWCGPQGLTAVLWERNPLGNWQIKTLDSLLSPADAAVWHLIRADGVNDQGQITGVGALVTGQSRAYLLTLP